ncbi:MAG TPA: heme-binding protein [Novosphingobium sp.]|nr:heme-binding protein [Novosphingobium sp.]
MTKLTEAEARAILSAASQHASDMGVAVAIAVADEAGMPFALIRMDNTRWISAEVAQAKAKCAALFVTPTSTFQGYAASSPGLATVPHIICAGGGVPIMREGVCIGAVGASGGSAAQDEEIALASLAALG